MKKIFDEHRDMMLFFLVLALLTMTFLGHVKDTLRDRQCIRDQLEYISELHIYVGKIKETQKKMEEKQKEMEETQRETEEELEEVEEENQTLKQELAYAKIELTNIIKKEPIVQEEQIPTSLIEQEIWTIRAY